MGPEGRTPEARLSPRALGVAGLPPPPLRTQPTRSPTGAARGARGRAGAAAGAWNSPRVRDGRGPSLRAAGGGPRGEPASRGRSRGRGARRSGGRGKGSAEREPQGAGRGGGRWGSRGRGPGRAPGAAGRAAPGAWRGSRRRCGDRRRRDAALREEAGPGRASPRSAPLWPGAGKLSELSAARGGGAPGPSRLEVRPRRPSRGRWGGEGTPRRGASVTRHGPLLGVFGREARERARDRGSQRTSPTHGERPGGAVRSPGTDWGRRQRPEMAAGSQVRVGGAPRQDEIWPGGGRAPGSGAVTPPRGPGRRREEGRCPLPARSGCGAARGWPFPEGS